MKSLTESIYESMSINERLEDDWFKCFEFRSKEDFKASGPQSFGTYVDKNDIEMVDADVNVEIDVPVINNYTEEDSNIDIKQLEDDRNSSTGNI